MTEQLGHRARRLWWSLHAGPPSVAEEAWACGHLSAPLAELWRSQHPLDRRHSVLVARKVEGSAPCGAPTWLVEAALLHDVGKADAAMGVSGRVVATLLGVAGIRRAPGRLGRYLNYTERGAATLARLDASAPVVTWAREHHLPDTDWTLPVQWALLLAEADSDASP